ncbi:hypothetical protein ACTS94_01050 [Empedobacter falsenii]
MLKKLSFILIILPISIFAQKKNTEILIPSSIRVYDRKEAHLVEKLAQKNWYSLTKNKQIYNLKKAKVSISKGYDECSGVETRIINNDNSENLIAFINSDYITNELKINKVIDSTLILLPSQHYNFNIKNTPYTLTASSKTKLIKYKENRNFDEVKDYQLSLINNLTKKRIILYQQADYVDTITEIEFIGDLDGDNQPDFIISSPSFYEESRYIIFLSRDYNWNKIIQQYSAIFYNQFDC